VEICARVYRPRRARESPLFRLVAQHLEELLRVWPERFARRHGPLRAVVERVLREFLECGLLEHGFAEAVQELVRLACGSDARPGIVVSLATAGDLLSPTRVRVLVSPCRLRFRGPTALKSHAAAPVPDQIAYRFSP